MKLKRKKYLFEKNKKKKEKINLKKQKKMIQLMLN